MPLVPLSKRPVLSFIDVAALVRNKLQQLRGARVYVDRAEDFQLVGVEVARRPGMKTPSVIPVRQLLLLAIP